MAMKAYTAGPEPGWRRRWGPVAAAALLALVLVPVYDIAWRSLKGSGGTDRAELSRLALGAAPRADVQARLEAVNKQLARAWKVQAQKDQLLAEKEQELQEARRRGQAPPQEQELRGKLERAEKELEVLRKAIDDDGGCGGGEGKDGSQEVAGLRKEIEELKQGKGHAQFSFDTLHDAAKQALYDDSQVFRHYLSTHAKTLQKAWEERTAGQRQRGIVIAAGGTYSGPIVNAWVTLYVLRHHLNSTLPAAVVYWGSNEGDNIAENLRTFFKERLTDVELIDASQLPYPRYQRGLAPEKGVQGWGFTGYKVKVFSIYAAPFREVLFLDSDCMPVLELSPLFEAAQYKASGNLFWADYHVGDSAWPVSSLYSLFQLPAPWEGGGAQRLRQTESGQLLLDRLRHWEVLEWLLWVNSHGELVYRAGYGDKDTFRLAFTLAGAAAKFQLCEHPPAVLLSNWRWKSIVHFHPNGSVLFHHRTPTKYARRSAVPPPSTAISARATPDWGSSIVGHYGLERCIEKDEQAQRIGPQDCPFSLYDWPAAERRCAPAYNHSAPPGTEQRLPLFELQPGSYFLAAEAAANVGFKLLESEGPG